MLQGSKKILAVVMFLGIFILGGLYSSASPCNGKISILKQPDGTNVTVRLYGDEFYMRMEGLDGYTLTYDDKTKFICYAKLNENGSDFVSTGLVYSDLKAPEMTEDKLVKMGLQKGMKLSNASATSKRTTKKENLSFDKVLQKSALNAKKYVYSTSRVKDIGVSRSVSPAADSTKNVTGLTVLIDFPDEKAEIGREDMDKFLNSENESVYKNRSSVMKYFKDVSGGKFIYKNIVTPYYTAKHERNYYDYKCKDVNELIKEVLDYLQSNGFDFSQLTLNDSKEVLGFNIMYAGIAEDGDATLWPHSSGTDYRTRDGIIFNSYQISDLPPYAPDQAPHYPEGPNMGTFIHESGHLVLGWPDTYDIDGSTQGTDLFDVMGFIEEKNPQPPNPYYRCIKAGWGNPIDLDQIDSGKNIQAVPNSLNPYVFKNANSDEWFFIESIIRNGLYSETRGEGLLIWHVDGTKADNTCENMTPTNHFMVSIEQADGLFDIEQGRTGDTRDFFYKGYKDCFGPDTIPNSNWWNDNSPTIRITNIGERGTSFTYEKVLQKDLTEEGKVTCDPTEENPNFLFDNSFNTVFTSKGQEMSIQYSFKDNTPYVVNKYTITLGDDSGFDPASWVLLGSKDNKKWIDVARVKSPDFDIRNGTNTYIVVGDKNYKHYKFVFKGQNGSSIKLRDIQLFGYQYTGALQISASSEKSSDFTAKNAFDNNTSTIWASDLKKGFITYRFKFPMLIKKYQVTFPNTVGSAPEKLKLWASNDGIQWSLLNLQKEISLNAKKTYTCDLSWNSDKFILYKLEIEDTKPIEISEIKFSK